MKAKVILTNSYSGRCVTLMVDLEETGCGNGNGYSFTFDSLSDSQRKKIERELGKMNAYYAKVEIIKIYNK